MQLNLKNVLVVSTAWAAVMYLFSTMLCSTLPVRKEKLDIIEMEYHVHRIVQVPEKVILNTNKTLADWEINTMNVSNILLHEEGFKSSPYLCSEGYVTVGLGTKLHKDKGQDPAKFPIRVNMAVAKIWMHKELAALDLQLKDGNHTNADIYKGLDHDRQAIILSMAYQMGLSGVKGFKNMWKALGNGTYALAAVHALDSRWAKQTPNRAERHARVLSGEKLEDVYDY